MVTIQDLRKRLDVMEYLGFDETEKMWVYSYKDVYHKDRMYGLLAYKQNVIELQSLRGLKLTKG
ncbi:hypothetical protein [Robertmurraya sp.]|uniref:hypothetical protein n=1 Tax=Robertmurraya sp. TaxID=2837525 RepID=UPI003704A7CF